MTQVERITPIVKLIVKCKTSMLKSSLCDYSDAWIIPRLYKTIRQKHEDLVLKKCAPFTDCISEINITQIDNAKDIDAVMPIYSLI